MTVQPLVALDIGSTKVACAIGLPHEGLPGFELLGSSLVPYPAVSDAWLGDPLMVSRTIEQALEATAVTAEFDRALVAIRHPLLGSEHVKASVPLGDEPITIRNHDLQRLRTAALTQALGVDREPLVIECLGCSGNGFQGVRDPRGMAATRLIGDFHVITLPVAARRALVQAVESVGLEIAKLSYTLPLSVAIGTSDLPRVQRVLAIDVGGVSTDIGLFVDGMLCALRVQPWGGLQLATQIAKELQVTMEQATTWSLEGTACRKAGVRPLIEARWAELSEAIMQLLQSQPRPDAVVISGRGALIDGFAEWVEQAAGMTAVLCRSERTSKLADLSRQVGLSPVLGLLESATGSDEPAARSQHLFNRLIDQTRNILTEYF
jgi:cell division ATPase FtsA